jgi:putative transposase
VQIITQLLSVLQGQLSNANLTHFAIIIESILSLSRPVTTSNGPGRSGAISRASNLSYRTIHRFYALKNINWSLINLILFKTFVYQKDKIYLLAADETVEDKAGKSTHGIGRFYASTLRKTIKSISFLAAVIIDIEAEKSHFLACQQLLPTPKTVNEGTKIANKKGCPKGSKNKPKTEPTAYSYHCLKNTLTLTINGFSCLLLDLKCFHLVLDKHNATLIHHFICTIP